MGPCGVGGWCGWQAKATSTPSRTCGQKHRTAGGAASPRCGTTGSGSVRCTLLAPAAGVAAAIVRQAVVWWSPAGGTVAQRRQCVCNGAARTPTQPCLSLAHAHGSVQPPQTQSPAFLSSSVLLVLLLHVLRILLLVLQARRWQCAGGEGFSTVEARRPAEPPGDLPRAAGGFEPGSAHHRQQAHRGLLRGPRWCHAGRRHAEPLAPPADVPSPALGRALGLHAADAGGCERASCVHEVACQLHTGVRAC
jgi:hypothetical protein